MSALLSIRASSLPLAFRCPGSLERGALRVDSAHEMADLGTAIHEGLRPLAEHGALDWDLLGEIAVRHRVDADDMRALCAIGAKLWPEISASFPDALTEVELTSEIAPGVFVTGHPDFLSRSAKIARAGDWKTGRKDSDYSEQMRGYGALVLLDDPELEEVTITVIWLRDAEIENYTMRRADVAPWRERLLGTIVQWDGVYRVGSHCQYCPRSHDCEAANALVRRDVAAMTDRALVARAECEIELMSPGEIIEMVRKASLVASLAGRVRDAVREHVRRHGDIVADGVRLTLEQENRRELDPLKSWPVLEANGFGDEDFAAVIDLRVSRVEKRVAECAGRGKGAAMVRKLRAELEEAGAVSVKTTEKLKEKRS